MKRRHRDKFYNRKYNEHHLVAKDIWWNNDPDNKERWKIIFHRAWHTVFWTKSTVEKILQILETEEAVLQWDFINDLKKALKPYEWYKEYHSHVIKNILNHKK